MNILLVALQHGNEVFGAHVIEYCKNRFPSVDSIIANPKAYKKNIRFCETDMNRSYNVPSPKSYEEIRAVKVLELSKKYDFVIDIHTTTADIDFIPIIADYNHSVARALTFTPTDNVVKMEFPSVSRSLIGSVQNSFSLEFNEDFAKTDKALQIVVNIIEGLCEADYGHFRNKTIFHVSDTIPDSADVEGEQNLCLSDKLKYYPVLIGEINYIGYKGFLARYTSAIRIHTET